MNKEKPTKEEIVESLKGSIKKWDDIIYREGLDRGGHNCPLCRMFFPSCAGCPVSLYSGCIGCGKTPYMNWEIHHGEAHFNYFPEIKKVLCPTCKKMAKKELDYLKKVLIWYEGKKDILKRKAVTVKAIREIEIYYITKQQKGGG